MEWLKEHFLALPLASFGVACISIALVYLKLAWFGSRRASKQWSKTLELSGDVELLKLGVKRVNPDTFDSEGDAASLYYQEVESFVYRAVRNDRRCFLRTSVIIHRAFYQWETCRGLGDNLMSQDTVGPIPCTGLQAKTDSSGKRYGSIVAVPDRRAPLHDIKADEERPTGTA